MAGVLDTLISGIVKSAMSEILKKTTGRSTATKRTKRKTRTTATSSTTSSRGRSKKAGPTLGSSGRGAKATGIAKKQVSKRRTSESRSKARRR